MKKCIRHLFLKPAIFALLTLLGILPLTLTVAHAQLKPGQLVVLDSLGGPSLLGAVYGVDAPTGNRSIVSQFPVTGQFAGARNVTVGPTGHVYVITTRFVVRVNPFTGNPTIISDLDDPLQGVGSDGEVIEGAFAGLTIADDGQIYTTMPTSKLLLRIDPETGNRTIINFLGDATLGPSILLADSIVLEDSGTTLLILDTGLATIVRLDLTTGQRTLVSSFKDASQGVTTQVVSDFALEPTGDILVTDSVNDLLIRVDPDNGSRTVVSDFGNIQQGSTGRKLEGVAVNEAGQIFVVDSQASSSILPSGSVFEVAPDGTRSIVSDFGDGTEGPKGFRPTKIAVAIGVSPTPEEIVLIKTVLLATEEIAVGKKAVIISGNAITNNDTLEAKVTVDKKAKTPAGFQVWGNVVEIGKRASVGGDVLWNQRINNQGEVRGTETRAADFPIFDALLPLHLALTGDAVILVKKKGLLSLPPGQFKNIIVERRAILVLEGGVYELENLIVEKQASVFYAAPVEIRASQGLTFGKKSRFGPVSGSALDAKSAVLYTEKNFTAGKRSSVQGNIIGPLGTVQFDRGASLTGFAYGRKVIFGKGAEARLNNFLEDAILSTP